MSEATIKKHGKIVGYHRDEGLIDSDSDRNLLQTENHIDQDLSCNLIIIIV